MPVGGRKAISPSACEIRLEFSGLLCCFMLSNQSQEKDEGSNMKGPLCHYGRGLWETC